VFRVPGGRLRPIERIPYDEFGYFRVEQVEGAGHSVRGDRPVELARLVHSFIP